MTRTRTISRPATRIAVASALVAVLFSCLPAGAESKPRGPVSKTIYSVLREPLPPEELRLANRAKDFVIKGPTFEYRVSKSTGAIHDLRVVRDGEEVISQRGAGQILLDGEPLSSNTSRAKTAVVSSSKEKVVIEARGAFRGPANAEAQVDFTLRHAFFNDGVVVSEVKLIPRADLPLRQGIIQQISTEGQFDHYLHKRRDEHGQEAARGGLPAVGKPLGFATLTSCLGVFSPRASLAIFTDSAATHLSRPSLETASVEVLGERGGSRELLLRQHIIRVAPGDEPFVLKAGEEFSFRTGISVAPNRLPHPRAHDLRMFIWIGDAKFPYPTDAEIEQVARWGFTVFQMHRVGNLGEPRPPAAEIERVIRKVHETGMLFVWLELADLMWANAPAVLELRTQGQWSRWQGFNYGGRYTDFMDPYCDLAATCLASPNGLAEYRLDCINRMMDRYDVDGIYLDDNLGYANCTLQKEHGHPHKVYDCLIELHEMNWRRRQTLRGRNPYALLISHCTKAFVLPVIADFDALLYGEGYSFNSTQDYWANYAAHLQSLRAHGMLYAGGKDAVRCPAAIAYNYDLLSGGGQYCQLDWRLFREKFPYATGVQPAERRYVETYNPAQFYFGLYESEPHYFANSTNLFATTNPRTHATLYRNRVWHDWLIAIANMAAKSEKTTLAFRSPAALGIASRKNYVLFDTHQRAAQNLAGHSIAAALQDIRVPGENLQCFVLREQPAHRPMHLWGGKRISEVWDAKRRVLSVELHGPTGLRDTVFFSAGQSGIARVNVTGQAASFAFHPAQNLVHGEITFTSQPVRMEVHVSPAMKSELPEMAVTPDALVASGLLTDN